MYEDEGIDKKVMITSKGRKETQVIKNVFNVNVDGWKERGRTPEKKIKTDGCVRNCEWKGSEWWPDAWQREITRKI